MPQIVGLGVVTPNVSLGKLTPLSTSNYLFYELILPNNNGSSRFRNDNKVVNYLIIIGLGIKSLGLAFVLSSINPYS